MSLQFRTATATDLPALVSLLQSRELPTDGVVELLRERPHHVVVAELNAVVVGSAALDVRGDWALLRSVAVARDLATLGVGTRLVTDALELAHTLQLASVFLLTTAAADWFLRFGFQVTTRDTVPADLLTHVEFRSACPAEAELMERKLQY